MAYEFDSDIKILVLGGVNKETKVKNPTQVEGYWRGTTKVTTKFGEKDAYVLETKDGKVALLGGAGLRSEFKNKKEDYMTIVIHTGQTLDTGKGNPMVVFKVGQNKKDYDPAGPQESSIQSASADAEDPYSYADDGEEESLFAEEEAVDEVPVAPARKPAQPLAKTPSAERQAKVAALLNRR